MMALPAGKLFSLVGGETEEMLRHAASRFGNWCTSVNKVAPRANLPEKFSYRLVAHQLQEDNRTCGIWTLVVSSAMKRVLHFMRKLS